jgi:hypothetical protein
MSLTIYGPLHLPQADEEMPLLVHHSKRLGLRDPLACIRTASLRTGVSVSGKPNFLRRDKGDETSPGSSQRPWQRRSSRHNSANCALVTGQLGNLFESRNAWWRREDSNCVPSAQSAPNRSLGPRDLLRPTSYPRTWQHGKSGASCRRIRPRETSVKTRRWGHHVHPWR